jgi:hypothetical protein
MEHHSNIKVFKFAYCGHSLTLFHIIRNGSGHTFKNLYGHDQALPSAKYNTDNSIMLHILLKIPAISAHPQITLFPSEIDYSLPFPAKIKFPAV